MNRLKISIILFYCCTTWISCSSLEEKGDPDLALNMAESYTYSLMKSTYGSSANNPGFTLDSWEFSPKTGYYVLDISMHWDARCCFLHYVECRDSLNAEVHVHKTGKIFKQVLYNKNSCAMTHQVANGAFSDVVDLYLLGDAIHEELNTK